jgi:hypothetical protein
LAPVLTGCTAYAIAESFGLKLGLDKKPRRAKGFYGIIVGCTAVGLLVNFAGINPIKALFLNQRIAGASAACSRDGSFEQQEGDGRQD